MGGAARFTGDEADRFRPLSRVREKGSPASRLTLRGA